MLPIGLTIRDLRQIRGFSLSQVAEKAMIDKSYLSKIENNKREPSLTSLNNICKAIGIPLNIFILMVEDETDERFSELTTLLKSAAIDILREKI